jgi:hypothetical protein
VVTGWFPLINSEGIPLEVLLLCFVQNGLVPSWTSFIDEAIDKEWNLETLRTRIETSTADVYGKQHSDEVLKRFDQYVKNKQV